MVLPPLAHEVLLNLLILTWEYMRYDHFRLRRALLLYRERTNCHAVQAYLPIVIVIAH